MNRLACAALFALSLSPAFAQSPPVITTTSVATGVQGSPYNFAFTSSGGTGSEIWFATGLPAPLSISSAGVITGTPATAGTFPINVQVTGTAGTDSRGFNLKINTPINITTASLPPATLGTPYSAFLTATGGEGPPYTWSFVIFTLGPGGLPTGLNLNSATGEIFGTPTDPAGDYPITVTATDTATPPQTSPSKNLTVTVVNPPLSITTAATLPRGVAGSAYNQTLAATGGSPPYSWSGGTGLPPNVTLSSGGALSGTPLSPGTYTFTGTVTDSTFDVSASRLFTLVVNPVLSITTTSLPGGTRGQAYTGGALASTGGQAPVTWSLATGTLPTGLTLNSNGTITGTPTVAGFFSFTARATDSGAGTANQIVTQPLSIDIAEPPLVISTASPLAPGTSGTTYPAVTFAATGGIPPYRNWGIATGSLPPGLTLVANTGVLSGTPTTPGSYSFDVRVEDSNTEVAEVATKNFTLVINPAAFTITTASPLTGATANTSYSLTFAATGGVSPYTNWTVLSGSLPAGLSLNSTTGVLTGTPTTPGTSNFTIRVADSQSEPALTQKSFQLTVAPPALVITTSSPLTGGSLASTYSQTFSATGGVSPYTWSLGTASVLPDGLTLSSGGVLSGSPTTPGTFPFTIEVRDSTGVLASQEFTLPISSTSPVITTSSLPNGQVSVAYNQPLAASGGTSPYSWSLATGTLPNGLFVSSGGAIQGTPTQAGIFTFSPRVTDTNGLTATRQLTIAIDSTGISITTPTPLTAGIVGTAYSRTLAGSGGAQPYTWAVVAGQLPPGINLNAASGVLSGTPTAVGSSSFTIQMTESGNGGIASKAFTLAINPVPLVITNADPLPGGVVGQVYSLPLNATGGTSPYSWSIQSGALPPGLTFSSGGVLSGTPTTVGSSTFTVRVADAAQPTQVTLKPFTLVVSPIGVTITTNSPLPPAFTKLNYSQTLAATGGTPGYTWSLVEGSSLPPGINLSSGGVLSGVATTPGNYTFTVQALDSGGEIAQFALKAFSLQVISSDIVVTSANPLPEARINVPYSFQFTATGGVPPLVWSLASGSLPPGLALSTTGLFAGTPTLAGSYTFTVRVRDSAGVLTEAPGITSAKAPSAAAAGAQTDMTFTLVVDPGFPVITTLSLPLGVPLLQYTATLAATGGTPPYTFALASGSLPTGFSLTVGGQIIGTPAGPLSASFVVRVNDRNGRSGTREFTLVVGQPQPPQRLPLEITTSALPEGTVGRIYATALTARNGTPPYSWGFSGLPEGLTGNASGEILGTPRRAGTFAIQATVGSDGGERATGTFSLVIKPAVVVIVTERAPDGRVDEPYSTSFAASGGLPPYGFAVAGGSLPPGTSLAPNGTLTGTPRETGVFSFTVEATDATGTKGSKAFSATIKLPPLQITTAALGNGFVGTAYSAALAATGGLRPYRWSASGLPEGLTLDAVSGVISGTPTTNGSFPVSVQVVDAATDTASKSFTIVVTTQISIVPVSLGSFIVGSPVSAGLSATGGRAPYSFSIQSGALPSGVSMNAQGVISGTPTAAGDYNVTVEARDANNISGSRSFTGRVVAPLIITTETAPPAPFAAAYSLSLAATGGMQPYTWSLASGSLPAGLTLSGAGTVSGTASAAGTFNVTVQVADSSNPPITAQRALSIQVTLPDVSGLNITVPANPQPAQQQTVGVAINAPYPVDVSGTLVLTFTPNTANNADDPAIQFSIGGRSVPFTIPAGQTQAVFRVPEVGLQTGTTAGTITLATTLTAAGGPLNCNCPLDRTIVIPRSAPVITSLRVQRTATGFDVTITGFSTSREVTQGTFRFTGTTNLQTTELTVPLTATFNSWFQSAASNAFGGQFSLRIPFTIQGDTATVNAVTVTLTNGTGNSQPSTANF